MGNVHRGIPKEIALHLKTMYDLRYFVETGTEKAYTARWAAEHFEKVWTIDSWEASNIYSTQRCKGIANLSLVFGDSRDRLPDVLNDVDSPALIWLDAHWTGRNSWQIDCPVLKELEIIGRSKHKHIVMIDDCHLFGGEERIEQFPTLGEVTGALKQHQWMFQDDVMVAIPWEVG